MVKLREDSMCAVIECIERGGTYQQAVDAIGAVR